MVKKLSHKLFRYIGVNHITVPIIFFLVALLPNIKIILCKDTSCESNYFDDEDRHVYLLKVIKLVRMGCSIVILCSIGLIQWYLIDNKIRPAPSNPSNLDSSTQMLMDLENQNQNQDQDQDQNQNQDQTQNQGQIQNQSQS